MSSSQKDFLFGLTAVLIVVLLTLAIFALPIWAWKASQTWRADVNGRAALAQAENERKVQIEDAKGRLEAEKLNAQAEIERARGAAEAIKVERGAITDSYIRYLWVRNIEKYEGQVIYVPTEAGLPILEAGQR